MKDQLSLSSRTAPRTSGETLPGMDRVQPTSDNASYGAFAPTSPLTLPSVDTLLIAAADARIRDLFWSHVDKNGPVHPRLGTRCWLWTANCAGRGHKNHPVNSRHGQFTYRLSPSTPWKGQQGPQHHVYAHRFAWVVARGPIPHGLYVLHHCDMPPCVNNAHHFLGTHDDNMKDAAKKRRLDGRSAVSRTRKLSLYDRLTIYQTPAYDGVCVDLARRYGVTKTCISLVRRGRFLGSGVWHGTIQTRQSA